MTIQKCLLSIAVSLVLSQTLSLAQKDKASFTTPEMINNSAPALFDCAHYCIVGFQIRWIFIPPAKIKIFYTPVVRHNTADLVTMSADETLNIPWLEYNKIFSANAKRIGDRLIQAGTKQSAEVGGGPTQYEGFGKTQSLNFKDADVVGNPMAYVVENLDAHVNGGGQGNLSEGSGRVSEISNSNNGGSRDTDGAANSYLDGMVNNSDSPLSMGNEIMTQMGAEMYKEMVKNHPVSYAWSETVKQVVDTFADSMSDMVVSFYGCNSGATPFKPFYISNLDGMLWRDGYPITDVHKSSLILNPLSDDLIKPSKEDSEGGSSLGQINEKFKSGWGHIYPRAGFVNTSDDYKVGAVTAARALNIASEQKKMRIRQYAGGTYDSVYFQQIHPTPSTSCYTNIANSIKGDDNNLKRNYAWNGWRRYQCPLTNIGGVLATIIWGDTGICIGKGTQE